jgi:NAD-dependent SIR2 family protein deacetylase
MSSANLQEFLARHERLFVLTGAGCSTESGIADYRDEQGQWRRATRPVNFQAFMAEASTRQRYWARGVIGWRKFRRAQPNTAHHALTRLQRLGRVQRLVTQNVDRLHQSAGATAVIDLHGRLDQVQCMQCGLQQQREELQQRLLGLNPQWGLLDASDGPDGDAELDGLDFSSFNVPDCAVCGGILKPDVVFFGESVPASRVSAAMQALQAADAVLIVGSSLMVYSGYRFVHAAAQAGKPIAAVNMGITRADELLSVKVQQPCGEALAFLLRDPEPPPAVRGQS